MKKQDKKIKLSLSIFVILIAMMLSCNFHKNEDLNYTGINKGNPRIKFDTTYCDFGNLTQGEKVAYNFKFKNIGTGDLLILDAYSTCGCTVPKYNKEPIAPGEEGKLEVVFDSTGKTGVQYKTVTLKLNTTIPEKTLVIKANVIINKNYKS